MTAPGVEINGWHIELTRRCPLACSACNRTINFNSKVIDPKQDIDVDLLYNFFDPNVINKSAFVLLQGNLGDPIYHPKFHDIAEHFFDVDLLSTITNGMHSVHFWERVLKTWPKNSKVTFSIDGLSDSNSIYRVNSNWDTLLKIFDLIATTQRQCTLNWKFIVFEHNKHQVQEAAELSKKIGFDEFQIQRSRKIDSANVIKPYYGNDIFTNPVQVDDRQLDPYCFTGDMHYIDAFGNYYPCCWWADMVEEPNEWSPVNIANCSAADVTEHFNIFKNNIVWEPDSSPWCCNRFCKKNKSGSALPNTQLGRIVIKNG